MGMVPLPYMCEFLVGMGDWRLTALDLPEILPYNLRVKGMALYSMLAAIWQVYGGLGGWIISTLPLLTIPHSECDRSRCDRVEILHRLPLH